MAVGRHLDRGVADGNVLVADRESLLYSQASVTSFVIMKMAGKIIETSRPGRFFD
jgi:hypothetical protein